MKKKKFYFDPNLFFISRILYTLSKLKKNKIIYANMHVTITWSSDKHTAV